MPEWEPDRSISVPDWLHAHAVVDHTTFGSGVVAQVGEYRGVPSVWIDFDYGERKGLALEFGLPHLGPHKRFRRRTPRQKDMQCSVCGAVPVVLNVDGQKFCEAHESEFRP
ncbi:hypothetical protein [Nocardioides campestrisoli]|uniref:hypothetical protein n=1 Tax=Nocardioides campestrisoli TaxID=2736757 RepID=UPI00163D453D|nr:hypothetical protein [Nocardioides campestrisoli]